LQGSDSLDWYLALLSRYAKLAPQESPVIFRELVTAVNHTEPAKVLSNNQEVNDGFGGKIEPIRLPALLLQTDITAFKDATSTIESSVIRIRTRLGFVISALDLARSNTPPSYKAKTQKRAAAP